MSSKPDGLGLKSLRKTDKETLWAFAAKGAFVAGGLFMLLFIPNVGGPELYGAFSLILAYSSLFGILCGKQVDRSIKRELAQSKFGLLSKRYFFKGMKVKLVLTAAAAAILTLFLQQVPVEVLVSNLLVFFFLALAMGLWSLVVASFEAIHRLVFVAIMYFVEYGVKIVCIVIIYLNGDLDVFSLIVSFIIGYGLSFLVGSYFLMRNFHRGRSQEQGAFPTSTSSYQHLLNRTLLYSISGLSFLALTRIDSIMLSYWSDLTEIGYYNVSSQITTKLAILSIPFMQGVAPLFANQNTSIKLFDGTLWKLTWLNLGLFLTLLLLSEPLIFLMFGPEFEGSVEILRIMAILPLLSGYKSFATKIFVMLDRPKENLYISLAILAINITLNLVLIPTMGSRGAALATVSSYLLGAVGILYFCRSFIVKQKTKKSLDKPGLAN